MFKPTPPINPPYQELRSTLNLRQIRHEIMGIMESSNISVKESRLASMADHTHKR